jgi:hypothetical protein
MTQQKGSPLVYLGIDKSYARSVLFMKLVFNFYLQYILKTIFISIDIVTCAGFRDE